MSVKVIVDWNELTCKDCPAWDKFSEPTPDNPLDVAKGICRMDLPKIGINCWPATNEDEWCMVGRQAMMELNDIAAEGIEKDLEADLEKKDTEPDEKFVPRTKKDLN